MTKALRLFAVVSVYLTACGALGPVSSLNVANSYIQPDGYNRSAVLVSESYPAPLIQAAKGDRFLLNVVNNLTDNTMLRSTSIHWHGLFQKGSAWADGPVGVTQCPVSPGHSFLYNFTSPDQTGTYWYHSHYETQYCDGLRGPLVIYDPNDPHKSLYDVDDESTVLTVGEWYHTPSPSAGAAPTGDSTLINGKGRSSGGPLVDLAIVNVEQGKRYRIRLVSISCDPNYNFTIVGHELTIIEADGELTKPVAVDRLQIYPGQRYSFILNANQPIGNYWIRALPNSGKNGLASGFTNGTNSAILRYKGAPIADPTIDQTATPRVLNETQLHALQNPAAPAGNVTHLDLVINRGGSFWTVNDAHFETPPVPVLLQILSGAQRVEDLLPSGSIYALPKGQTVELSLTSKVGSHPLHLHGHSFSVVQSSGSNAVNYDDPVRRDVTLVGPQNPTVIRFVTDNSGPWILHCHIDWHLVNGLAVVFAEAPLQDIVSADTPTPAAWDQLCPIFSALPSSATAIQTVTAT